MRTRDLKVLFVRPVFGIDASFVKVDRALLERHYQVTPLAVDLGDRLRLLRVLKALSRHDVCFVWFADVNAYSAVVAGQILGKPVLIVPGFYELANFPEGGYGLRLESRRRWRQGMFALRHAAGVLPVSEFHVEALEEAGVGRGRLRLVYHGFEVPEAPAGDFPKRPLVVTIAPCSDTNRVWRKGLEAFAGAAARVTDAGFVLVGGYSAEIGEHLQRLAEGRLTLTGRLSDEELQDVLHRAQVYCQLSAVESFGCALAEAMLCECVPVVTNRGSLPEVAGDVGYYVEYGDVEGTVAAIEQALVSDRGSAARERIATLFPLEKRERGLVEAIESVVRR